MKRPFRGLEGMSVRPGTEREVPEGPKMDLLERLGALHHALQPGATVEDTQAWMQALAVIRREVEADPASDRYDRETVDVMERKIAELVSEIVAGKAEPDFKPARTWVAALGAAVHRRRTAAAGNREESGTKLN
ncbi:MAG: hypothetical protein J0H11_09715 [Rhizobiales bacterium]|nr:hypothetical protein [Hyphomicrobiales bacterium]